MTIKRGTAKGICRSCKHDKPDLYAGYCGDCRAAYGRKTNGITADSKNWHEQHELEKIDYAKKVKSGEAEKQLPPKSSVEKDALELRIAYFHIRRAVTELLVELDKVGYSVPDTMKHYKNFGGLSEPFSSLDRIRRLLEKQPSE
jgi:thiol-disulfide isomerase/thioredoxin